MSKKIKVKTLSYDGFIPEVILTGSIYHFGELYDGGGGSEKIIELLEDGTVSPDNENVVAFNIINEIDYDDPIDTLVIAKDIY